MSIYTVLGPIEPHQLGPTSMHEHVFIDARVWHTESDEPGPEDGIVRLENYGFHRWNLVANPNNLIIDNLDEAVEELTFLTEVGGSGIVDLSNIGLGREVEKLREVSRRTGLHIISGAGCYINDSHPEWVERISEDDLAQVFFDDLTTGMDGTDIRAGILGEIGTSAPVTPRERKVLAAAAQASLRTSTTVSVHLDPAGQRGIEVFEFLTKQGMSPDRIVLGHADEQLDEGYHREMLATGATLAYDTFGSDYYFNGHFKDPGDDERLRLLLPLLHEGFHEQIVLGCDVFTKIHMKRYGGFGYDHLLRRIVPLMRLEGISDEVLHTVIVDNPRRVLDRP